MPRSISATMAASAACRIFRKAGNPNDLTLLFDWEDIERRKRYHVVGRTAREDAPSRSRRRT